ncbi:uncharacterized protein LOC119372595 isoform X3 [Rhipicephalus sanguineus]|uniref:uncharacterized protein LOC125756369 isoform X2 n=1 Tax=Rhipicephalus sanguineus TaxID=34632 RepID=UPI0020C3CC8A|nr:uncharacterized protein LOC125756369 isoform X2 [Rhipicephalus sanguineus]XP_049272814.1 uncharacterized protein LOC125759000 isoform X2 [Rhipicephalus sanguineus]XP_049275905.1 uncharacterized protein LOC119372595 isoform X3 [Rhipicephalus sanguineus]
MPSCCVPGCKSRGSQGVPATSYHFYLIQYNKVIEHLMQQAPIHPLIPLSSCKVALKACCCLHRLLQLLMKASKLASPHLHRLT